MSVRYHPPVDPEYASDEEWNNYCDWQDERHNALLDEAYDEIEDDEE